LSGAADKNANGAAVQGNSAHPDKNIQWQAERLYGAVGLQPKITA